MQPKAATMLLRSKKLPPITMWKRCGEVKVCLGGSAEKEILKDLPSHRSRPGSTQAHANQQRMQVTGRTEGSPSRTSRSPLRRYFDSCTDFRCIVCSRADLSSCRRTARECLYSYTCHSMVLSMDNALAKYGMMCELRGAWSCSSSIFP
jgi:hypothetical protein